jgi:hypothetical protein
MAIYEGWWPFTLNQLKTATRQTYVDKAYIRYEIFNRKGILKSKMA